MRRLPVAWRQISPNRAPELWSLDVKPSPSGFEAQIVHGNPAGDDLVLLVSVASNVEPAFAATRPQLHQLRGLVVVTKPGTYPHDLETAGQARDVVRVIVEGLRRARDVLQPRGALHLFLAVPAGLAMMIGQMLNTFGPVPRMLARNFVPGAPLTSRTRTKSSKPHLLSTSACRCCSQRDAAGLPDGPRRRAQQRRRLIDHQSV
jgi:hypothetical protein